MVNLNKLYLQLEQQRSHVLGYPLNNSLQNWDWLGPFIPFVLNNLGDPWKGGTYGVNTFEQERWVVTKFAELFNLDSDPYGYVTSCGTEGNLKGIVDGLRKFPNAVVYASDKIHYSVDKACEITRAPLKKIKTDNFHKICVEDFDKHLHRNTPAVVVLTAGTTMAGAIDDVRGVIEILNKHTVPYYLHIDAALFGLLLSPLKIGPWFDFRLPIDSISVSGHKMLGVPIPCGVYVSKKHSSFQGVEYIGSNDSTIMGSRCGLAVLMLWYLLHELGWAGIAEVAKRCVETAEYALEKLHSVWHCWKHVYSNILVIGKPNDVIVKHWQLAVKGNESHIICMPHVTRRMIDDFYSELTFSHGLT